MAYSDKVVDHYNNPRNVGTLDKASAEVGTGLVGAPECGDVMRLQIRVNPETQVIEEAKFKTFGCGSAIASSSLATEWIKGRTVEDALGDQEHRHREGTVASSGQDSLLCARRGCDSRGYWRLEEKERCRRSCASDSRSALRACLTRPTSCRIGRTATGKRIMSNLVTIESKPAEGASAAPAQPRSNRQPASPAHGLAGDRSRHQAHPDRDGQGRCFAGRRWPASRGNGRRLLRAFLFDQVRYSAAGT